MKLEKNAMLRGNQDQERYTESLNIMMLNFESKTCKLLKKGKYVCNSLNNPTLA